MDVWWKLWLMGYSVLGQKPKELLSLLQSEYKMNLKIHEPILARSKIIKFIGSIFCKVFCIKNFESC